VWSKILFVRSLGARSGMLDFSTQISNFSSVVHVQLTCASNLGLEVERDLRSSGVST